MTFLRWSVLAVLTVVFLVYAPVWVSAGVALAAWAAWWAQ